MTQVSGAFVSPQDSRFASVFYQNGDIVFKPAKYLNGLILQGIRSGNPVVKYEIQPHPDKKG